MLADGERPVGGAKGVNLKKVCHATTMVRSKEDRQEMEAAWERERDKGIAPLAKTAVILSYEKRFV